MNKAFCVECMELVDCNIKESEITAKINNSEFSYNEKRAFCADCGEEIYVEELEELNLQKRYESYAISKGLITVAEIKKLLEKYQIKPSALSRALGWGSATINRYLAGGFPSKAHSDILKQLFDEKKFENVKGYFKSRAKSVKANKKVVIHNAEVVANYNVSLSNEQKWKIFNYA